MEKRMTTTTTQPSQLTTADRRAIAREYVLEQAQAAHAARLAAAARIEELRKLETEPEPLTEEVIALAAQHGIAAEDCWPGMPNSEAEWAEYHANEAAELSDTRAERERRLMALVDDDGIIQPCGKTPCLTDPALLNPLWDPMSYTASSRCHCLD